MSITTWRFPWKLYKYWSKFLEFHSVPCAPFLTVFFKCINCNNGFPFPVSRALLWPVRPDRRFPHSPQLCLSQSYFHKMTSSLPNHDKEEWLYSPSLFCLCPPIHPSIHASIYLSIPVLSPCSPHSWVQVCWGGRQTNSQEWLNECLINERKKR